MGTIEYDSSVPDGDPVAENKYFESYSCGTEFLKDMGTFTYQSVEAQKPDCGFYNRDLKLTQVNNYGAGG